MTYERVYQLNQYLASEEGGRLEADQIHLLRAAFRQYSDAFDTIHPQVMRRVNGLPVLFVVHRLYQRLGWKNAPRLAYSERSLRHFERVWRMVEEGMREIQAGGGEPEGT